MPRVDPFARGFKNSNKIYNMKKILFMLLFVSNIAGAQNINIPAPDTATIESKAVLTTRGATAQPFYGQNIEVVSLGALPGALQYHGDCEPYETFTPWQARSEGNDGKFIHQHEWVYAEREDVNDEWLNTTLAMHCPCECSKTENQARICSACFRHEWRTSEYGQRPKEKLKSKYLQIVEKTPKNNVVINLGPGAGDGELRFHETDGGSVFVGIATGKNPKANSVVFSITSDAKAMTISGSDGIEGETFRKDATKFYVSKTSDGYAVKSKGALPEYSVYAIKLTFD